MGSSECALTTGEKHAHRPLDNPEGGGNFAIAVTGVAEKQRGRLSLWKDGETGPDSFTFVGLYCRLGGFVLKRWQVACADHLGKDIGASPASQPVQTAVDHHPREPGGDVSFTAFGHRIDPQRQQCLLGGVFCFPGIAKNTPGEADETRVVTAKDFGESGVGKRTHQLINTAGRQILTPQHSNRAQQVPTVAGDVEKDGDFPVSLDARRCGKFNSRRHQPLIAFLKIVDPQEETHTPASLVPENRSLSVTVRLGQQDPGGCSPRPDDHPTLWSTVIRDGRGVFNQLESEDAHKELDRAVVVVDDDRD
jgi:hypothetical protein